MCRVNLISILNKKHSIVNSKEEKTMGKPCKRHFKAFNMREGSSKIKKIVKNTRFVICTLLIAVFMLACGKGEIIPSRKTALEKAVEAKLAPASEDKRIDILGRTRGLGMRDEEYQRFNTEEYTRIYENTFLEVENNPLSTFSIDVDTASYSNIRRFINRNSLPPKDAVRIEEMINYFTYEYPQPEGGHPFSIITEISTSPWNPSYRLVHIGLQGKKIALDKMPPSNLVFLIDVSGSMDSPDKLPLLQTAFKLLVNQMRPIDRISIVVYAGAAGLILPSTPGNYKNRIIAAIDKLYAGGSTAGGMGIKLAYRIAKQNYIRNGNNRVILATDGDFNVGVSSTSELVRLIENKRRDGIFLTVLGFGTGNYKDSRMESLADKGNGNYAYIDSILEARKVLLKEMGGTLFTIAKDVKIQVEFNPVLVKAYRLIGYENRILKSEDFNDDKKDAGELGSGHSVTALYEIIPKGVSTDLPAVDPLKYQETRIRENAQRSKEIMTIKFRYKEPSGRESRLIVKPVLDQNIPIDETTNNFRFSAAVAEFGMLLRDSKFKGGSSYDRSLELAQRSVGRDTEGYRAEFIRLIKMAKLLAGK
jgi:Ca-activated chloride channel family protein